MIKCDICGEKRPAEKIATITTDRSIQWHLPPGTILESVRYCTDQVICSFKAERAQLAQPQAA